MHISLAGTMLQYNPAFGTMYEKIFQNMSSWGFLSEGPIDGVLLASFLARQVPCSDPGMYEMSSGEVLGGFLF